MTSDRDASLRLVGELLGMAHLVGDLAQIRVRNVTIIDGSLTVEVLATSDNPILLRAQAASVMGGLSGLDLADLFPVLDFTTFAVRLVNQVGEDAFWIMSSPEDAKFAESGAVRWLANSIFQDNTPDYRRSQADRLIGQLETGLRDLLHFHWRTALGNEYSSSVFLTPLLKDLRDMARREGEDELDDRTLLDFTMLPQLAAAAYSEPLLVDHGCVLDPSALKHDLATLNKIRRKVAHHRTVTAQDLETVRSVVADILQPVGEHHPDLVADFLSSRWDDAVQALMNDLSVGMETEDPPDAGTMPETDRQAIAAAMLEKQLEAAQHAQTVLAGLVVPATRRSIHELADAALSDLVVALGDLTEVARRDGLTVEVAMAATDRHAVAMARIRQLGEDIKRIRVVEHSIG